jgi:dipeptidyl aminopeptidase/acylaminoacyl peptidase
MPLYRTKSNPAVLKPILVLILALPALLISCTNTGPAQSTQTASVDALVTKAGATIRAELTVNAPTATPEPQRVVYSSSKGGNWNLYYSHVGVGDEVPLTTDPGDEQYPAWSADGNQIAYQSNQDGSWQIVVMDSDGADKRQLTTAGNNQHPSWAPDGSRIAFDSDREGGTHIYVMDANGENQIRLPGLYYPVESEPVWSPDGSTIAFIAVNDSAFPGCGEDCTESVYLMNPKGEVSLRVSEPGWYYSPAWSPDGKKLVFVHGYYDGSDVEDYDVVSEARGNPDVGGFTRPLDTRLYMYRYFLSVNFSPEGTHYVICSTSAVFKMNAAGQEEGPPAHIADCYQKPVAGGPAIRIIEGPEFINPDDDGYYAIGDAMVQP